MERAVTSRGIRTINLYDLFANIVPGVYLLIGLYVLVRPVPLFRAAFHPSATMPGGLLLLLTVIVVAFIAGQVLQLLGSTYDGDHGFDRLMWSVRGRDGECRYDISDVERHFWDMCRSEFQLTGEFDSHDRLFKLLMAFLEQRGRARALRMQALYLFVRGVFVGTVLLLIVATLLYWTLAFELMSERVVVVVRSRQVLVGYAVLLFALASLTDRARKQTESDWIVYTVTTAYLEMSESQ